MAHQDSQSPASGDAPRRRRTRWSWSIGEMGETALVFRERNGRLYGQVGGRAGRRVALRDSKTGPGWVDTPANRELAKKWAREQHQALVDGRVRAGDPTPTVARVTAAFVASRTDLDLDSTSLAEDRRCPELFTRAFGADRDLSLLTLGEWQRFIRARQTGAIDSWGEPVPEPVKPEDPPRRPVRARTVESDCEWLMRVCRWALEWEDPVTNRPLLASHPLSRDPFRKAVPHEAHPRRPVATQDRYEALLVVADAVHPYLRPLLMLVNWTGRRISAVVALRYADLRLPKTPTAPHGAIQWPGETDKMRRPWRAPISKEARAALDAVLAARPGLGEAPLFPAPKNPEKAIDRWLASKWLEAAERLAKQPKQDGSLWHAYRRGWATARKHLPVVDVAQAGGWKTTAVLQEIYQQPDDATLYRVVSEAAELREAK